MLDQFQSTFNEIQTSLVEILPSLTIGTVFLVVFILLGSALRAFAKRKLIKRIEDQLLVNFIGRIIFLSMLIIGIMIFLNIIGLGNAAGGLLAGAGVSAIVIGFAFKDIGENFLAGFFLAFSRPFSIGDVVEVESLKGVVKSLSFRNTHIRTFDGKDIFVPNGMLIKNPLINYTRDGLLRHDFVIGLDYGDNITEASALIMKTLYSEERIEQDEGEKPFLQLEEFGTSTINIRIFYWINSYNFTGNLARLKSEVMNSVLVALAQGGYSMPADIVELKIYQGNQPIPISIHSKDK